MVPFIGKAVSLLTGPGLTVLALKAAYEDVQKDLQNSIAGKNYRFHGSRFRQLAAGGEECDKASQDPAKKCSSPVDIVKELNFKKSSFLCVLARVCVCAFCHESPTDTPHPTFAVLAAMGGTTAVAGAAASIAIGVAKAAGKKAVAAILPAGVNHVMNVGVEFGCRIDAKTKKMSHVLANMFMLQYREFKASSSPWTDIGGMVGFDIGGYIGTEALFELEYTRAAQQTIQVTGNPARR